MQTEALEGAPALLDLPTDHETPAPASNKAARAGLILSKETDAAMLRLSQTVGAAPSRTYGLADVHYVAGEEELVAHREATRWR